MSLTSHGWQYFAVSRAHSDREVAPGQTVEPSRDILVVWNRIASHRACRTLNRAYAYLAQLCSRKECAGTLFFSVARQ